MSIKRIKLKETQVSMLKNLVELEETNGKRIKITEDQYNRLFKDKNINETVDRVTEDGGIAVTFLEFANESITFLKEILTDPSQSGLSPFWVKLGVTKGELFSLFADSGIIGAASYGTYKGSKKLFSIKKKNLVSNLRKLYQKLAKEFQDESVMLGNDIELSEDNYPPGAANDSNAPYNQNDTGHESSSDDVFQHIGSIENGEHSIAFFDDGDGNKYASFYVKSVSKFESSVTKAEEIANEVNSKYNEGTLKVDQDDVEGGNEITTIGPNVISYIKEYYVNEGNYEQIKQYIGNMEETTTAGSVGGSYEAPLSSSPIKKHGGMEEVTDTSSSGQYSTPKIWAKNPKLSRFSKDPVYPGGKIVAENGDQMQRYVLNLGEVYIIASDDKDARNEAKKLIKLINSNFPEADAQLSTPQLKQKTFEMYETVAKETGRTVNEVKELIEKSGLNLK